MACTQRSNGSDQDLSDGLLVLDDTHDIAAVAEKLGTAEFHRIMDDPTIKCFDKYFYEEKMKAARTGVHESPREKPQIDRQSVAVGADGGSLSAADDWEALYTTVRNEFTAGSEHVKQGDAFQEIKAVADSLFSPPHPGDVWVILVILVAMLAPLAALYLAFLVYLIPTFLVLSLHLYTVRARPGQAEH
jgi:hypothetical protein